MGCKLLKKGENKEKEACLKKKKTQFYREVPTIQSPLWLTEDKLLHSMLSLCHSTHAVTLFISPAVDLNQIKQVIKS